MHLLCISEQPGYSYVFTVVADELVSLKARTLPYSTDPPQCPFSAWCIFCVPFIFVIDKQMNSFPLLEMVLLIRDTSTSHVSAYVSSLSDAEDIMGHTKFRIVINIFRFPVDMSSTKTVVATEDFLDILVLFSQSCLTLCSAMDCSTPDFPIPHHLPEFAGRCPSSQ